MITTYTKINTFRPRFDVYYVGLTGVIKQNAFRYFFLRKLVDKLIQITTYCRKYGKTVVVLVDTSSIPAYVLAYLNAVNINHMCVIKSEDDYMDTNFFLVEDPEVFLSRNTEVVFFLRPIGSEEDEMDLDGAPVKYIDYPAFKEIKPVKGNPNTVVDNDPEKRFQKMADAYDVFDLLPQGQIEDLDYYQRIMENKPEPTEGPKPLRMGKNK
jgi:hypothetical protein